MKTYSIGRDINCDIVISDSTDVISRRHALLNVTSSGKMTIIDQSSNGTYVNGIRISQNVPVPLTRKDIVSFAHIAKLDWNQVPKSNIWVKYLIAALIAVALIFGVIFGIKSIKDNNGGQQGEAVANDSTLIEQQDQNSVDSIKNVGRQDSINKDAGKSDQDSVKVSKSAPKKKGTAQPKKEKESKDSKETKEQKESKEKSSNRKRTIG